MKDISRRNFLKGAAAGMLGVGAASVLPGALPNAMAEAAVYTPGTYTAAADGFGGPVSVTMTFSETAITEVAIDAAGETATIGGAAAEKLATAIKEGQTPLVDGVSSATMTSNAVKRAAAQCVAQAKGVDVAAIIGGGETGTAKEPDNEDWIGTAPEIDESQITETLTCDMLMSAPETAAWLRLSRLRTWAWTSSWRRRRRRYRAPATGLARSIRATRRRPA